MAEIADIVPIYIIVIFPKSEMAATAILNFS